MALSIIGAGFGRTGTDSMRHALRMLGFGPCFHMFEIMENEAHKTAWRKVAAGGAPNWEALFARFQSTVDWPAAFYWRDLAAHFPDAKILLTVRSTESWLRSMQNTILPSLADSTDENSLGLKLIRDQVFGGNITDLDHVARVYEQNIADVQAAFGPDRLLTYQLGSGWAPLCEFLDVAVPQADFPRGNTPEDFHKLVRPARG